MDNLQKKRLTHTLVPGSEKLLNNERSFQPRAYVKPLRSRFCETLTGTAISGKLYKIQSMFKRSSWMFCVSLDNGKEIFRGSQAEAHRAFALEDRHEHAAAAIAKRKEAAAKKPVKDKTKTATTAVNAAEKVLSAA